MALVRKYKNRTYKIGITGGTCSGKSVVRHVLANGAFSVLDADDALGILMAASPQLTRQITKKYGNTVLDHYGNISPQKFDKLQFENPFERKFVQDLVNPLIRDELKRFLYGPLGTFIRAVEWSNIYETDCQHLFDEIWLVQVTPAVQVKRIMARDGLNREEAELLIIAESPTTQEQKAQIATRVIDNSGDRAKTDAAVRKILEEIRDRVFNAF